MPWGQKPSSKLPYVARSTQQCTINLFRCSRQSNVQCIVFATIPFLCQNWNQNGFKRKPQCEKQQLTLDFMCYKHIKIVESEVKILKPLTDPFCLVQAVQEYIRRQGNAPGPLFLSSSEQPITSKHLKHLISTSYNLMCYNTHGLRIGCARMVRHPNTTAGSVEILCL